MTSDDLCVGSGLIHTGAARFLVHLLKYKGIEPAAEVLAAAMVRYLPDDASAVIPLPRAVVRRMRYGVDAASLLARRIGSLADLRVVNALAAPVWWPPHAGAGRIDRRPPRFRLIRPVPRGSILVDDVLTTGATIRAAGAITGVKCALTATRADRASFE